MAESNAFKNFRSSLKLAEELLAIERSNYSNPPKQSEQKAVQGLRGGAAVLMVASFEYYLKEICKEHLVKLTSIPPCVDFSRLPDKMRVQSVYNTLERSMKGPLYQKSIPKINRLSNVENACKIIVSNNINPEAFIDTGSNPNSETVKEMFSNMGISNIFSLIKPDYEHELGQTVAETFISDKLNEIVSRRHIIAHTANALNISRTDLKSSLKHLIILSKLLDKQLNKHIKDLKRSAAI